MEFNFNLENLQSCCRVCLQKGEINIWDFKVQLSGSNESNMGTAEELCAVTSADTCRYMNALDLMEIFGNTIDIFELSEVFPLLCWQCLEDFKLCYMFHEKLKNAKIHLKIAYNECLNQYVEEEHLIESPDDETREEVKELSTAAVGHETNEEIPDDTIEFVATEEILPVNIKPKITRSATYRCLNDNSSSLVVTQYIPSTLEPIPKPLDPKVEEDDEELPPPRNLLTCKAVEVKDVSQLEALEIPLVLDNEKLTATPPVYMCQYCPKAFAKSEFLKTHIQKTHVCKFCTQPFNLATDLYRHIREVHTEHRCVICQKILSSTTNLRHHIRRVHRINLPAKMTLLDFIQTAEEAGGDSVTSSHSIAQINEDVEYAEDQFDTSIYFSKADDVEIPNKDSMEIN